MLKRGDKTLASVLRERKGKDFTRRWAGGGRVRAMEISGEKQQGQGSSPIVMMMSQPANAEVFIELVDLS